MVHLSLGDYKPCSCSGMGYSFSLLDNIHARMSIKVLFMVFRSLSTLPEFTGLIQDMTGRQNHEPTSDLVTSGCGPGTSQPLTSERLAGTTVVGSHGCDRELSDSAGNIMTSPI